MMADYYSPTVIQQRIPNCDMTPLEALLLSEIFTTEPEEDGQWLFAEVTTNDMPEFEVSELKAALVASEGVASQAFDFVCAEVKKARPEDVFIYLDMSIMSWELLLQDIIKRSSSTNYITAITAFTCSKMRSDGFGGMVMLITAQAIRAKSLDDVLALMLDDAEALGEIPKEEGHIALSDGGVAVREGEGAGEG